MPAGDHPGRNRSRDVVRVSLSRRRACQWLLLPATQMAVPSLAWGNAARVAAARMWPAQEYTRVIVESPTPLAYELRSLKDPHRVVLDLAGVDLTSGIAELPSRLQPTDPYVAGIRFGKAAPGTLRIVFDLKTEAQPEVFALGPVADFGHRVIVDFYPATPLDPLMALVEENRRAAAAAEGTAPGSAGDRASPAQREGREPARRKVTVALDPGHGGEDPGAVGRRGTYEKHVALAIAKKLKARIDAEPGMRAMLTRDDDYYVPLAARVQKARRVQADLFVSIHADAFRVPTARGSSVFALSENGATSAAAQWLAQKENAADLIGGVNVGTGDPIVARTVIDMLQASQINDSLKAGRHVLDGIGSINPLHKSAVEQAGFAVLKAPDIPSILVETAFISNPDEELKLRSDRHQGRFADSMHEGIRRYFAANPPLARTARG